MKTINIVLFGIGNVGSTLIKQLHENKSQFSAQNLQLKLCIITNSKFVFYESEKSTSSWESDFKNFSIPFKFEELFAYINKQDLENLIAVDATNSNTFAQHYIKLIKNGFNIVSANKIANTLDNNYYNKLRQTLKEYNKQFLYETNVGAGLPIIELVKNLHQSGEQILKIKGVFSGSLSYIFNEFSEKDIPFSKVLNKASSLGLTESDPRDDLSGKDVARKLLILARELGVKAEIEDVDIQSLVPKNLNGKTTLHQFKSRITELNSTFLKLKNKQKTNQVLRYVGELDVVKNTLKVKLVSEEKHTSLGSLKGSDAFFEIHTASYGNHPIIIQGAGAGKEVTARGLLSDIVKIAKSEMITKIKEIA